MKCLFHGSLFSNYWNEQIVICALAKPPIVFLSSSHGNYQSNAEWVLVCLPFRMIYWTVNMLVYRIPVCLPLNVMYWAIQTHCYVLFLLPVTKSLRCVCILLILLKFTLIPNGFVDKPIWNAVFNSWSKDVLPP